MPTPPDSKDFIVILRTFYRDIQRLAGDQELRSMLSSERTVTADVVRQRDDPAYQACWPEGLRSLTKPSAAGRCGSAASTPDD